MTFFTESSLPPQTQQPPEPMNNSNGIIVSRHQNAVRETHNLPILETDAHGN